MGGTGIGERGGLIARGIALDYHMRPLQGWAWRWVSGSFMASLGGGQFFSGGVVAARLMSWFEGRLGLRTFAALPLPATGNRLASSSPN